MNSLSKAEHTRDQNSRRLQYSLDVLTDGSEHTGHGTIFLTVSRPPKYHAAAAAIAAKEVKSDNRSSCSTSTTTPRDDDDNDNDEDVSFVHDESAMIQARYALTGISSLTARLASDQNFKLSPVRALLCPSRTDVACTAGIPSLLLALSNHTLTGELSVIGPAGMDEYMDDMSNLILGRRRKYPRVSTCVVPTTGDDGAVAWWKVFEDEFIVVHARTIELDDRGEERDFSAASGSDDESSSVSSSTSSSSYDTSSSSSSSSSKQNDDGALNQDRHPPEVSLSTVYIVTLCGTGRPTTERDHVGSPTTVVSTTNNTSCDKYSFAVLPSGVDSTKCCNMLQSLPDRVKSSSSLQSEQQTTPLRFILHVNPKEECIEGGGCSSAPNRRRTPTVVSPAPIRARDMDATILGKGTTELSPTTITLTQDDDDDDGTTTTRSLQNHQRFLRIHPDLLQLSKSHLATIPDDNGGGWDDGILIRASYRAKHLHRTMPSAFPIRRRRRTRKSTDPPGLVLAAALVVDDDARHDDPLSSVPVRKLVSCTSVLLRWARCDREGLSSNDDSGGGGVFFRTIDRNREIHSKARKGWCVEQPVLSTSAAPCDETDFDRCRSRLERFYSGAPPHERADAQEAEVPMMTTPTKASERMILQVTPLLQKVKRWMTKR